MKVADDDTNQSTYNHIRHIFSAALGPIRISILSWPPAAMIEEKVVYPRFSASV